MKARFPLILAGAFTLLGLITLVALLFYTRNKLTSRTDTLPIIATAPNFVMTDSQGQPFDSNSLSGVVWIVDFFFTSCPGPCPTMGKNLAKILEEYHSNDLSVVSISVDPKNDVPETLNRYAKKFNADPNRWHFLTAPESLVRSVSMDGFKLGNDAIINHSTYFALVDRKGQIRGFYNGTDNKAVVKLIEDISKLLN